MGIERDWDHLGSRLRLARQSGGISLRDLSRRIGVSASHVSQVERGLASFSVPVLYRVANELGISMDSLFEPLAGETAAGQTDAMPGPVLHPLDAEPSSIVLRQAQRPTIDLADGPRWERLTPRPETGSEFLEVHYAPASERAHEGEFIRHQGREYGVIVEGQLHVEVGFEQTVLNAGDSICFDSNVPHRFTNRGTSPVRAIWFVLDRATADSVEEPGRVLADSSHWA